MQPALLIPVLTLAIGLVVAAVALLLRDLVWRRRRAVDERLAGDAEVLRIDQLPLARQATESAGLAGRFDRWFAQIIEQSGVQLGTETAFLLTVACGLLLGGVLFVWRDDLWVGALGMLVGMLLCIGFFVFRSTQRNNQLRNQLPVAISLLARAVQAGQTIEQGFELVGNHAEQPLGIEFRRSDQHLKMGLSMEATMRALMRRVPLLEMQVLATTLVVQRRAGGSLPDTLESLVAVLRDRASFYRHFRASTAAARMSTIVICCAGPLLATYMWIWQREYIQNFWEYPQGKGLLAVSVALQIAGLIWIYRLLRPDY